MKLLASEAARAVEDGSAQVLIQAQLADFEGGHYKLMPVLKLEPVYLELFAAFAGSPGPIRSSPEPRRHQKEWQ